MDKLIEIGCGIFGFTATVCTAVYHFTHYSWDAAHTVGLITFVCIGSILALYCVEE